MNGNNVISKIGYQLNTNRIAKVSEILLVFILAFALLKLLKPYAEDNPLLKMGIVWCINIFLLVLVWLGIKLRGQKWSDFGLTFGHINSKESLGIILRSLLVCILGLLGYMLGAVIMTNITGMPEGADMSNYEYFHNNIFMLIISLLGVYIVSSFGEEVFYRAFLINRLTELGFNSGYGKIIAVVLSSVIFGSVHYEWGPTGMVSTGFMGLVMGFFYLKYKKRLWILVLAHAYMDTILLVQVYIAGS